RTSQQSPIPTSQHRYAAPPTFAPATAFALSNGSRPNPPLTLQQTTLNRSMGYDRSAAQIAPGFQFKPSPFYEAKERLGEVKICEGALLARVVEGILTNAGSDGEPPPLGELQREGLGHTRIRE